MQKKLRHLALFAIFIIPPTTIHACDGVNTFAFGCIEGGLNEFISTLFQYVSAFVMAFAVLGLIWAGYTYITAGGNPDSISKAKDIIYTSISSVVALALAYGIFKLLGMI